MTTPNTNSRIAKRQDPGPGFLRVLVSFVVGLVVVVGVGVGVAYVTRSDDPATTARAETRADARTDASVTARDTAAARRSTTAATSQAPTSGPTPTDAALHADAIEASAADPRLEVGEPVNVEASPGDTPDRDLAVDSAPPVPVTYADAEASYLARDYDRAAEQFAVWASAHPGNVWGAYMLGLSLWKSKQLGDAETAFLGALDLDAQHLKSLINLARVRLELGNAEEALMPIERAVQIDVQSIPAHRVHARTLHNLGRRDDAARAYQEALRRDPEDAWSLNNYGWMLAEAGRFTESLPPLARAVSVGDETDAAAQAIFRNNLGAALEGAGYYNAAAEAYAAALQSDSTHARAATSLARVESLRPMQSLPDPDLRELAQQFLETLGQGLAMVAPM